MESKEEERLINEMIEAMKKIPKLSGYKGKVLLIPPELLGKHYKLTGKRWKRTGKC